MDVWAQISVESAGIETSRESMLCKPAAWTTEMATGGVALPTLPAIYFTCIAAKAGL